MNTLLASMLPIAGIALSAAIYAAAQAIRDFRRPNHVWSAVGGGVSLALLWAAGTILLTPVETHAVTIDLPKL